GPGVPSGNLATLFQPFYRGDNAALAEGHGLGLAIAQRVIGAHAGSISASNAEGGGLRVEIRLPLAT
ncbi:ATP-binding protein, partial [Acinetobacter baumannii]